MPTPFPIVAWGSADDISAYSTGSGTPTVTGGVADPFGGAGAYTIDDNDAGSGENKYKAVSFGANGTQQVAIFAKAGTATASDVGVFDVTAATFRAVLRLTWSGGVPTASIVSGSGTVHGVVSVGNGWYLVLWAADNVVAANSNRLYLYGAINSPVTTTGTTSYYLRNVVALDVLDRAVSWSDPRKGSSRSQSGAGVFTAWLKGRDYRLRADVLDIPASPRANPAIVSGWYGDNESIGINCGVDVMLHAGRGTATLRWIRDRADCTTGNDAVLLEPLEGGVELTDNGDRQVPGFLLHSLTPFLGY